MTAVADERRGAGAAVARVGRSADGAVAADHRNAVRGSGAEEGDLRHTRASIGRRRGRAVESSRCRVVEGMAGDEGGRERDSRHASRRLDRRGYRQHAGGLARSAHGRIAWASPAQIGIDESRVGVSRTARRCNACAMRKSEGQLPPGTPVVELTSGNMGIGLAVACAVMGRRLIAVMSEGNSPERRLLLAAYGAEIELVPQAPGGLPGKVSGEDLALVEARTVALVEELRAWRPDQFNNPSNPRAHELGTGPELWEQSGGTLGAFMAIVGTGGTFVGIARALKARDAAIRCAGGRACRSPGAGGEADRVPRPQTSGCGLRHGPAAVGCRPLRRDHPDRR